MALVYELAYGASDVYKINMKVYISSLVNSLLNKTDITFEYALGNIELELNKAIPLGFIINELVNNTIKFAFPDKNNGRLFISLKNKGNNIVLIVKDNGIGLPEDLDIYNSNTLGFTLITGIVQQIDGDLSQIEMTELDLN